MPTLTQVSVRMSWRHHTRDVFPVLDVPLRNMTRPGMARCFRTSLGRAGGSVLRVPPPTAAPRAAGPGGGSRLRRLPRGRSRPTDVPVGEERAGGGEDDAGERACRAERKGHDAAPPGGELRLDERAQIVEVACVGGELGQVRTPGFGPIDEGEE